MEFLISIIVPVYKTENYLEKCINSILKQTYNKIEIILVNDGSPDRCGEICDEYSTKDKRVKVIHTKNNGVSKARNIGLEIAEGDYIVFVDSDDWIEDNMLEHLLKNIIDADVELSACGTSTDKKNGDVINVVKPEPTRILNKVEFLMRYGENPIGFTTIMYSSVFFKKNFQHQIRFNESISIAEDTLFTVECIVKSKGLVYEAKPLYHVVQSDNSATRSGFHLKHLTAISAYNEIIGIVTPFSKNVANRFECLIVQYATNMLISIYEGKKKDQDYFEIVKDIKKIIKKRTFVFIFNEGFSLKSKIRTLLVLYVKSIFLTLRKYK